jgi:hypothetical protein
MAAIKSIIMKGWVQDTSIAVMSMVVFIICLIVLPMLMPGYAGYAYIVAIAIFIVVMSALGYRIEDKKAA